MQRKSVQDIPYHNGVAETKSDLKDSPENLNSLVVMEFGKDVPAAAVTWLAARISAPRLQGGGELQVRWNEDPDNEVSSGKKLGQVTEERSNRPTLGQVIEK